MELMNLAEATTKLYINYVSSPGLKLETRINISKLFYEKISKDDYLLSALDYIRQFTTDNEYYLEEICSLLKPFLVSYFTTPKHSEKDLVAVKKI